MIAMVVAGQRSAEYRPDYVGYEVDPVTGAHCHYEEADQADRCPTVFSALLDSWAQVDVWGWPEPIPDNGCDGSDALDIYIALIDGGGAYTTSPYIDQDSGDGRMGASAHIVLDSRIPLWEYEGYVAHEFNHVLQFAVDFTEPALVPWEAVATRAEEWTYPGTGTGPDMVPDFQDVPWMSLLGDSDELWFEFGQWSYYEYGGVLLVDWLNAEYAVDGPELWLSMTNTTWDNDPSFLDALGYAVGADPETAMVEFSLARALVGTPETPEWAQAYAHAPVKIQQVLDAFDQPVELNKPPYDYGVVYFDVQVDEPAMFVVDGGSAARWRVLLVSDGEAFDGANPIRVDRSQLVGVVNLGPEDFGGNDTWRSRPLTVWLERAAIEEEEGRRTCSAASGAGGLMLWPTLLLVCRRRSKRPR